MKKILLFLLIGFSNLLQAQFTEELIFKGCQYCSPNEIITIDFDHDGDEDLILGSKYEENLVLLENLNDGNYKDPQTLISGIYGMVNLTVEDFDGDGDFDIMYGSEEEYTSQSGIFLLENKNQKFRKPTQISDKYNRFSLKDIEGDGDQDLLVFDLKNIDSEECRLVYFENKNGRFLPGKIFLEKVGRNSQVDDFNGDGLLDVLVCNNKTTSILFGSRNGHFDDPVLLEERSDSSVFNFMEIESWDLDSDGDLDIVIRTSYSRSMTFYENLGAGVFAPETLLNTYLYRTRQSSFYDLDNDGLNDFFGESEEYGGTGSLYWSKNLGDNTFAPSEKIHRSRFVNYVFSDTYGKQSNGKQIFIINYETGSLSKFALEGLIPIKEGMFSKKKRPMESHLADFDGDGDKDLISTFANKEPLALFINDGGNFIEKKWFENLTTGSMQVIVEDLDNDGDQDFLFSAYINKYLKIYYFINDGKANFTRKHWYTKKNDGVKFKRIILSDLNNDGIKELIVPSITHFIIMKSNQDGTFGSEKRVDVSYGKFRYSESIYKLLSKDLNGDNLNDIAILTGTGNSRKPRKLLLYFNQGNNVFSQVEALNDLDINIREITFEDLDNDGQKDFIYGTNNGVIIWYKNDGDGNFVDKNELTLMEEGISHLFACDLDGDLDVDIIVNSYFSSKTVVYKNDGDANFDEPEVFLNKNIDDLQIVAFDQQRALNVLYSDYEMGEIVLFKQEGRKKVFGINKLWSKLFKRGHKL